MRNLLLRLLDWVAAKLDRAAAQALARAAQKQDVPASKTGLQPDGCVVTWIDIPVEKRTFTTYYGFVDLARTTPDRPEDPVRREIDALTGKAEAVNYPRGS